MAGAFVLPAGVSWLFFGDVYMKPMLFGAAAYVLAAGIYFRAAGRLAAATGAFKRALFFLWLYCGICGLPFVAAALLR